MEKPPMLPTICGTAVATIVVSMAARAMVSMRPTSTAPRLDAAPVAGCEVCGTAAVTCSACPTVLGPPPPQFVHLPPATDVRGRRSQDQLLAVEGHLPDLVDAQPLGIQA